MRCPRYAADPSEDHREISPPGFVLKWEGHNITKAFGVHDTQAELLARVPLFSGLAYPLQCLCISSPATNDIV